MNKALLLIVLSACGSPPSSVPPITEDARSAPTEDASPEQIACVAHSAITSSKALVALTVFCPTTHSYRAEISIFDKDGFACGTTRDNVACNQSVIYECSGPDLETVITRFAFDGALVLMDCTLVKR